MNRSLVNQRLSNTRRHLLFSRMASALYLLFAGIQITAGGFVLSLSCTCLIAVRVSLFALPLFLGMLSVISGILDLHYRRRDSACIETAIRFVDFLIVAGNVALLILLTTFLSRQAKNALKNDVRLCVSYFIFLSVIQVVWCLIHCRRIPAMQSFTSVRNHNYRAEGTDLDLIGLDPEI